LANFLKSPHVRDGFIQQNTFATKTRRHEVSLKYTIFSLGLGGFVAILSVLSVLGANRESKNTEAFSSGLPVCHTPFWLCRGL
jgi:hypothetical protein